ncbi:hypothetical protein [Gordonia otitidis]|uniref:Uncharacterized protein n=1 Tax=Gordonia otitidis (strain DSM 44809 / CCUG 52243 / JCM 12355 / NBRC 100426 / IFM 10032) TaxID=1108044 RepID=H5THX2_GORO1|nr:hypothetical protein [Gordonia otitidis]UEA60465.1 hypothetical protein LK459_06325 [Gordonia otitidis]GAB33080.1 hypothetical protein GOOTI_039_00060 [Gordonia otitidis NBRC 100426]
MTAAAELAGLVDAPPLRTSVTRSTAFAVLTRRGIGSATRSGLLFFAVGSPIVFFTCL